MIQEAKTREEIDKCFSVFTVLRPHVEKNTFADQVFEQFKEGYHLMYVEEDEQVVAVMGYRYVTNLAWGKFLYVDDLCSLPTTRQRGNGGKLIDFAKEEARKYGCKQVHLDSGYQRLDAHRLYLNKGFFLMAHHFQCNLE